MNCKALFVVFLIVIFTFVSCGCNLSVTISTTTTSNNSRSYDFQPSETSPSSYTEDDNTIKDDSDNEDAFPQLTDFPDSYIVGEKAQELFSEYKSFKSIVLHDETGETEIDPEDPNLVRLYNWIGNSFDKGYCLATGLVSPDSYNQLLYSQSRYIEINIGFAIPKGCTRYYITRSVILLVFDETERVYEDVPNTYHAYPYLGLNAAGKNINMLKSW